MMLYLPGKLVDNVFRELNARAVDALADAERAYQRERYDIQRRHARDAEDAHMAWVRAFKEME